MKARLAFQALLLVPLGLAPVTAQQPMKAHIQASPDGVVEIRAVGGRLRIVGSGTKEVTVEGTVRPDAARVELKQDGSRTIVRVMVPRGSYNQIESDLVVTVPRNSAVEVHTTTAGIEVAGVRGSMQLKTMQGDIQVQDVRRSLHAQSLNGDIVINGAADTVRAQSMAGSLSIAKSRGMLLLSSVSGDVNISDSSVPAGEIKSVSGTIDFTGKIDATSRVRFANVSGTTQLMLSPKVAANFNVRSFSGEILNDFGVQAVKLSKYTPSKELIFATGKSKASLVVETTSGDVHIKKQ
jgi:hypothetical protein